jgi:predicted AAA+ superfamily ATPase
MPLPTVFDTCVPKPEVLAGELPDAIFAADLWAVVTGNAHQDYLDPNRFFAGTYPTDNLKVLVKDIVERLAGSEGATPIFKLETGFGGGKTHSLIACVHAAKASSQVRSLLQDYRISRFPNPDVTRIAAFVGEDSSPLTGTEVTVDGATVRTYTPWGQIAMMAGGIAGYERIKENDLQGGVPSRSDLSKALGDKPVLILIDELVLYMARCAALPQDHPRSKINAQWNTFLQTLFSVTDQRPSTALILTLPTEQDANRRVTAELRRYLDAVLDAPEEAQRTVARKARALTPTQATERRRSGSAVGFFGDQVAPSAGRAGQLVCPLACLFEAHIGHTPQ